MSTVKGTATLKKILYPKGVYETSGGFAICSFMPIEMEEGQVEVNETFKTFSIKGDMPPLKEGSEYHFVAEEGERHPQFGLGYELSFIRQNVNLNTADPKSVKSFLELVLTARQAKSLYETFDNPIEIIEAKDLEKLCTAKNIGLKTAQRIVDHYESQKDYSYAYIELGKYELTVKTIKKIVDFYGSPELAVQKVLENPYQLMQMDGISFKTCDKIFLKIGGEINAPIRIKSFLIFMLEEEAGKGHTWTSPRDIIEATSDFIKDADISLIGSILLEDPDMFYLTEDKSRLSLSAFQRLEHLVSVELNRILKAENDFEYDGWEEFVDAVEKDQGWKFTPQQRNEAMVMMLENNVSILQGYGGTGKAQVNTTKIPLPHGGEKDLGDIEVGDHVLDRLGQPTKVLGVYPQGKLDVYEVTLTDGRKTYCNDEHLWSYYSSKGNLVTKTLREMIDNGIKHNGDGCYKYKIPVAPAIEYEEKDFSVDPYVLGAFIGDGSLTERQLTISSDDEFLVDKVSRIIGAKGYVRNKANFSYTFFLPNPQSMGLTVKTKYQTADIFGGYSQLMCKAKDKRIPREYFYGSVEQRLSLIQGLMDTDGCINDDLRANVRFSNTSSGLIQDMQYILRSLGYHSTIIEDVREDKGICYELSVNIPSSEKSKLFTLPRRKEIAQKHSNTSKNRIYSKVGIKAVEKMSYQEEMTCIYVDNEEHLYLTNDFIVTHNTTTLKAVADVLQEKGYLYAQCALSGKASQNLAMVTGKDGSTIHRLLAYSPMDGGFYYNRRNKLPYDIIIIDEISMVDARLFGHLLLAIRSGAKIIMLGDSQQLESIGIPVMIPMIKSGLIPTLTLTEIHRQALKSAVVTDSIAIREGKQVLGRETGRVVHGELEDLEYDLIDNDDEIFLHVMREFHKHIQVEDIMDVQVLTQQREKGKSPCTRLNNACQKIYNPPSDLKEEHFIGKTVKEKDILGNEIEEKVGYYLREGDKVINIKNNYDAEDENGQSNPVFNGNIGILERFDIDENSDKYIVINFEGIGRVKIYEDSYRSIQLAYAITVHKSQGSSSKVIILALPYHFTLNTRQLFYTAITRTRTHCVVIAMKKTIVSAIKKDDVSNKRTYLSDYLIDLDDSSEKKSN